MLSFSSEAVCMKFQTLFIYLQTGIMKSARFKIKTIKAMFSKLR